MDYIKCIFLQDLFYYKKGDICELCKPYYFFYKNYGLIISIKEWREEKINKILNNV